MTQPLEGRVAVVTGASRGIGEAIARRLATAGATVAVSARTERPADAALPGTIHETADRINKKGGRAIAIRADLSRADSRRNLIEETEKALGPVDILVNDAAVPYFEPVEEFTERHFQLMFEVQVRAPFELTQLVLPGMKERKSGWILNISSRAAIHPRPPFRGGLGGGTVYGMCKAALERFTTGLASEVAQDGVVVNVLSPSGIVRTPGVDHHGLIPKGMEHIAEPVELIAEASLALVSGGVDDLTGRITYSKELLEELGREAGPLD